MLWVAYQQYYEVKEPFQQSHLKFQLYLSPPTGEKKKKKKNQKKIGSLK